MIRRHRWESTYVLGDRDSVSTSPVSREPIHNTIVEHSGRGWFNDGRPNDRPRHDEPLTLCWCGRKYVETDWETVRACRGVSCGRSTCQEPTP